MNMKQGSSYCININILTTSGVLSPLVAEGPSATSRLKTPDVVRMKCE